MKNFIQRVASLGLAGILMNCGGDGGGTPSVTLVSIEVTPNPSVMAAGSVRQFAATGTFSDGSVQDVSTMVAWSSSSEATATVTSTSESAGLVTGVTAGMTSIQATSADISGNAPLTVTSAGAYAYVINSDDQTVSQFSIGASGQLIPLVPATVNDYGGGPFWIAVAPGGRYAYVADSIANAISQYTIGATGALTPMSPATVDTGNFAGSDLESMTIDPTSRYMYVLHTYAVSQWAIGASGALTPMGPRFSANFNGITVHPNGRYAYGTDYRTSTIVQFKIGTDGALSLMKSVHVEVPPVGIIGALVIAPGGRYAYLPYYGSAVSILQYQISTDGALSPASPASVAAGNVGGPEMIDPRGQYAYGVGGPSGVTQYAIRPDGTVSLAGGLPNPPASPVGTIAIDGSGRYLYVVFSGPSSFVYGYILGANGALKPTVPASFQTGAASYSIDTTR